MYEQKKKLIYQDHDSGRGSQGRRSKFRSTLNYGITLTSSLTIYIYIINILYTDKNFPCNLKKKSFSYKLLYGKFSKALFFYYRYLPQKNKNEIILSEGRKKREREI